MRDLHFEKLTKRAIAAYTLERKALLDGDETALQEAGDQKTALLQELDAIEAQVRVAPDHAISEQNRDGLASVLSIIARRTAENEQLAKANSPSARV